jgi:hypothetical protein
MPVSSGSYASFVPSFDQQADEYYAPVAQQKIDLYPCPHLAPGMAGKG